LLHRNQVAVGNVTCRPHDGHPDSTRSFAAEV
jgi:hypothetical protein